MIHGAPLHGCCAGRSPLLIMRRMVEGLTARSAPASLIVTSPRSAFVSYADDFVILSRGRAAEALTWTKGVMTKLGLVLNEAKTSLRDSRRERFTFLGYSFGPHHPYNPSARTYLYMSASPSKESVQRLKTKVRELLVPGNNDPWPEMRDV
jgi:RNA-directed DNA polymerase